MALTYTGFGALADDFAALLLLVADPRGRSPVADTVFPKYFNNYSMKDLQNLSMSIS
jgi:hypothetical protein